MILKIETVQNKTQGWKIIQANEIDTLGYSCEENCSFDPELVDVQDGLDLTDLRNPERLCTPEAASHFLQITVDRKKIYWTNGQVFLTNDNGKTIEKLY